MKLSNLLIIGICIGLAGASAPPNTPRHPDRRTGAVKVKEYV